MNNKKGFTLIEILAVVVVISLIFILALPKINNTLKNKKSDIDNTTNNIIITASKLYISDHVNEFLKFDGNVYCLPLTTLTKDGYLESPVRNITDDKDITETMSVKISFNGGYKYEIVNRKDCKVQINETEAVYQEYQVGDVVTYNDINFYVIENSDSKSDSVTMLKETPLTVDEVNTYGVGHVNRYTVGSIGKARNRNGYGGMAYYTSETCGYVNGSEVYDDCITNYDLSDVKYVVDAWTNDKLIASDLKEDSLGYKTRLISVEDLTNNLGYAKEDRATSIKLNTETTPSWVYNDNYSYWTMSLYNSSTSGVWNVSFDGGSTGINVYNNDRVVRPVINLYKSAMQ